MKKIGDVKNFSIYEFYFKFRVYYKNEFGEHLEYVFESLNEAIDYIKQWV